MKAKEVEPGKGPPRSEISFVTNVCGLLVFFAAVVVQLDHFTGVEAVSAWIAQTSGVAIDGISVLCAMAILISISAVILIDMIVFRRHASGHTVARPDRGPAIHLGRIATKLLGFYVVIALAWLAYASIQEYGDFYGRYFDVVDVLLPFILIVALPYFALTDRTMAEPEDGYYHFGRLLLGLGLGRRRFPYAVPYIYDLGMGWVVKLFFLPLMFSYLAFEVENLAGIDLAAVFDSPGNLYDLLYSSLYGIDLVFATCGYVMTLKLTNSQIKSTDPTLLGWLVCLACYQPAASIVFDLYLHYDNGFYWGQWLSAHPIAYMAWAAAIIVLIILYTLASVSLGFRFSNLTYRGLASSGVYRLTKHPAYISKNLSWWMISIPFVPTDDVFLAVKFCLLLLGVNVIYFLRARTEENHLSNYPEYVAYANWMNEHGMFAWLGRIFPFFRYSEVRARRSGSVVWWRRLPGSQLGGAPR